MVVVPVPSFRVDGLADGTDDAERAEVGLLDVFFAETTEETDGGRGGVEVGDLVLVDGLPEAGGRGVGGCGLEDGGGDAIGERAVDEVARGIG